MSELIQWLWQFNLEISLLLAAVVIARAVLRRFAQTYNNYLLWFSMPLALLAMKGVVNLELSSSVETHVQPLRAAVQANVIHNYIVRPVERYDPWLMLGVAIVIVSILLLLRLLQQHCSLRRELARVSGHKTAKIRSAYPIVIVTKDGFSPAVYGFFKPKIFFPLELINTLSKHQVALIIQHEEQHIKQGHLWLNLLWDVLVCLLWFNPLTYIARQQFRHDQELYCDYLVLKNSDQHDRRHYGHALLSTASATHSVSLLCSWKTFNQLEERIMNIKSTFSTKKKLLIILFGGILVACASTYSIATSETSSPEKTFITIDKDQSHNVKIVSGNLVYVVEGTEQYVVDNGERRKMNEADKAAYEKLIEDALIDGEFDIDFDGILDGVQKTIALNLNSDDVRVIELSQVHQSLKGLEGLKGLESLKGLEGLSVLGNLESLVELEKLNDIDVKVLSNIDLSIASTERELDDVLRSIEDAKEHEHSNKAKLKKTASNLKKLQKQIAKDKKRMQETREQVRIATKEALNEIQRDAI